MKRHDVDVVVVGLGPAGASAAGIAAQTGLKVLGVERNPELGLPVQCAEFVPSPMVGYTRKDGVLQQRISRMRTFLPSGDAVESDFPGIMIDRAKFDQALAQDAADAGAKLVCSTRLVQLDIEEGVAVFEQPTAMLQVKYRLLIAADGPHSTVGKLMGLPALPIVHTRQYCVPLLNPHDATDIWLSDDFPGGYGWLFPKGCVANLGLGIDKRYQADLKLPLDNLHAQLAAVGVVGNEVLSRSGGAIPVGGLRRHIAYDRIMFVGDAAGLTHPITGAGISAAVLSGERAGEAAAEYIAHGRSGALQDYEEDIQDQYETTLLRACKQRTRLMQGWRTALAREDDFMRQGWIAFNEYFND